MGCGPDNYEVRESQADRVLGRLKRDKKATIFDLSMSAGWAPLASIRRAIGTLRARGFDIATQYKDGQNRYVYLGR